MIPKTGTTLTAFEVEDENTLTHKLIVEKERILGKSDGLEALKQAVYIMLNIERYEWVIFSPNFGIELKDLFGMPIPYCLSELKRRIRECLMVDDRISDVTNFEFEVNGRDVLCTFEVVSNIGDFTHEMGVTL